MLDRFLVWVGAGVVSVGLSAAMLSGAGLAVAEDGAESGVGGETTSESSNSAESQTDSDTEAADAPGGDVDGTDEDATDEDATDDEEDATDDEAVEPDEDATDDEAVEPDEDTEPVKSDSGTVASERADATQVTHSGQRDTTEPDPTEAEDNEAAKKDEEDVTATSDEPEAPVQRTAVVVDTAIAETEESPEVEAVAFASAAAAEVDATAAAPPLQGLLNVIGTIVFNLYGLVTRAVGGPPVLPPNSTVTVRSSSLVLECGCNEGDTIEVPADWYIPAGAEANPPDRVTVLQHGFLAQGPWYSHTAAAIAEQTNSIVVAPSITSNFLAADACWLGATPMHQAIAGLFDDDNTALADSALAAGYAGPIPNRVVLMGHSLGGGAVIGAAGAMADNGTLDRLAGVVMLDGVPLDSAAVESIEKVPDDIPIYQLAAPKYFWNQFGVGTDALLQARPDQFIGVTLVGGSHVDAMRGGNPLIQFSQQLVSGFSTPENVAAAQILMVGWVNDMFAGNQDEGIYLDPGEVLTIDTPAGEATLVDLPNDLEKPFILNPLQPLVALGNGFFTFEPSCVAESVASARCTDSVAA